MQRDTFVNISINKYNHLNKKKDVEKQGTEPLFIHIIHTLENKNGQYILL